MLVGHFDAPLVCKPSKNHANQQLNEEGEQNELVKHVLGGCYLYLSCLRILHDFGVVTSVDYHADDPLSVLESTTAQNKLVIVEINQFLVKVLDGAANRTESTLEAVEEVVGGITDDVALEPTKLRR